MLAPGQKGVIQIDITNRCDILKCSNCTRNLLYHDNRFTMTLDNFKRAVDSLADYPGIIGVFGGNPCLHPQFEEFSRYLKQVIPQAKRRGLWSNNLLNHGEIVREVYGYFNLNVHTNQKSAEKIHQLLPWAKVWGEDRCSKHGPLLVAIKDVVHDEKKMWEMIEKCDINLYWSGAITQINGNLRAYFCEVASGFDLMYNEDHGIEVTPGWWKRPIEDYDHQIKRWCPNCGVPLKMKGHDDLEFVDDVSQTHLDRVKLTIKSKSMDREIQVHDQVDTGLTHEATDYMHIRKPSQNEPVR